jgi:hypothetical protein
MDMTETIEATSSVEELVARFPAAVSIMLRHNLPCLVCGEPVWGTIGELARSNGWSDQAITSLVEELKGAYTEAKHP